MIWKINRLDNGAEIQQLADSLSSQTPFPLPLANILFQRGFQSFSDVKSFFSPSLESIHDPWLMMDMEKAVDRMVAALQNKEKVLIYGDYDVDGTSAVSLVCLYFKSIGFHFDYYIPDRYTEGYGISFQGVEFAATAGYTLMVALDCGIKAVDKVKFGREKGVEFIICDHHTPGKELPPATAILNPLQQGCSYPNKHLTGAGVAFKFLSALQQKLPILGIIKETQNENSVLSQFSDLITLSIACDIVPIVGENRTIAIEGLKKLKEDPLPGLKALMELGDPARDWDIGDMVFFLGPRVNSAGRMGSAKEAVKLLTGEGADISLFAAGLDESNADRKETDEQILQEALGKISLDQQYDAKSTTVLYDANWHKGVIGIVASRLIEQYYRPTILLTRSEGQKWVGSGRSVPGYDLYAALDACAAHLVQFGGHKYAAGLTLMEQDIEPFRVQFEQYVQSTLQEQHRTPVLEIAYELGFDYLNPKFVRLLKRFGPFGPENREPVFMTRNVWVRDCRVLKEKHIRFVLEHQGIRLEAIGFGMAAKWEAINELKLDVAWHVSEKTFRGITTLQLMLKDFRSTH